MNDDKELDLLKELEEEHDELEMPVAVEEPWVETEQSTLLDAFIYLTREVDTTGRMHPQRKMTLDTSDNEACSVPRFLDTLIDLL